MRTAGLAGSVTAVDERRPELDVSPAAAGYPPQSPPNDALLIPVVHALVDGVVQVARQIGPLPPIRSEAFLAAEPAQQIAALLVAAEAWLIADPHRVIRSVLKQASDDIHGGESARWRDWAVNRVPFAELQRRRAVPGQLATRSTS